MVVFGVRITAMPKLMPRKGYAICIPVSRDDSRTKGGLLVPDSAKKSLEDPRFVRAVIERCESCEELKPGDHVLIIKHDALLTEYTGEERILCGNEAIFCRLED